MMRQRNVSYYFYKQNEREDYEVVKINRDSKIIDILDYDIDYFYDPGTDKYYADIEEMKEDYKELGKNELPQYCYGCYSDYMKLDANSIIKDACYDLHEDAYMDVPISPLQKKLDEFCEQYKQETMTFFKDTEKVVKLY